LGRRTLPFNRPEKSIIDVIHHLADPANANTLEELGGSGGNFYSYVWVAVIIQELQYWPGQRFKLFALFFIQCHNLSLQVAAGPSWPNKFIHRKPGTFAPLFYTGAAPVIKAVKPFGRTKEQNFFYFGVKKTAYHTLYAPVH
jgi:hypothetical protein